MAIVTLVAITRAGIAQDFFGAGSPPLLLEAGASRQRIDADDPADNSLQQSSPKVIELAAPPAEAKSPDEKLLYWKFDWEGWDGLSFELKQRTPLGDPLAKFREDMGLKNRFLYLEEAKLNGRIGARVAVDYAAFSTTNQLEGFDDGAEVRRARIYAQGDVLLLIPVSYKIELGYIPNQFYIEDAYLAIRDLGYLGTLKFGQFRTPFSLDAYTSTRDISFMEPAAPVTALAPGVNAGLQVGRSVFEDRMTWAFGLFADGAGQDYGDASKDYGRAVARVTGLPIFRENPDDPNSHQLLHLGLDLNWLYSTSGTVRYRTRPESHLAPYVLDTGDIDANNAVTLGSEIAWVNGPISAQTEFLQSIVEEPQGTPLSFYGVYGQVGYFLTGESRMYNPREGRFSRVRPLREFDGSRGNWGALEVVYRFSYVDLIDDVVDGGRMRLNTLGLNWYPHSHVHWTFNFITGDVDKPGSDGRVYIFETRLEVDF